MKKQGLIISFLVVLTIQLAGIAWSLRILEYISKPLLVVLLFIYALMVTHSGKRQMRTWLLAALFFSWLGDLLLMLQQNASLYFMLGLSAFLLAHVAYILLFYGMRVAEKLPARPLLLVMVAAYYAGLIIFLSPYLGEFRLPVRIYGLVISCMLMLAAHTLYMKDRVTGIWITTGALLFVVSDSMLAVNKFYHAFPGAGLAIMLTYGLAQLFLVIGLTRYLGSADKE